MKFLLISLLIIIFFPLSAGCAITKEFGPYYGKVIDAETKEPIEGAAVLVVFYTESYGPAGAITHYADALETATDKNGEFNFPPHRITLFRPLQGWVKHGYFTIFRPGFGCYPKHKDVKPMFVPNGTLPEEQYVTIELPRLKTREEMLDNIDCFPLGVPDVKMQTLIELNNIESKNMGLQPTHIKGIEK